MEQISGPLAVELIPGKHCDFINYLVKRARAQSGACAEVQFPDYGTALWSIGSRRFSKKALRFQHISFAKRTRAQSGTCAEVQIPDYGTLLWSPDSRNGSRKHCDISTYLAKRTRDQSGAWAEVQFPDYGTELLSPGNRIFSKKAK
jgi:hypothetical protein